MQWVSLVAIGEIYLVYKSSVNEMATKHLNPNPKMLMTDSYSMDLKYTLIFSGDIFNRTSKPSIPSHRCGMPNCNTSQSNLREDLLYIVHTLYKSNS